MKNQCKICGKICKALGAHTKNQHNLTSQEYYDKFYGKHYCPVCGKETAFRSINQGYLTYCSIKCADSEKSIFVTNNPQKNPKIKAKTNQTCINKYGVINPFQIPEVKKKCIRNNHTKDALNKRTNSLRKNIDEFCKKNDCIPMEEALKLNPCNGWWSEVDFIIYKKWRKCVPTKYIDFIKNYKPRNNRSKNEEKLCQIIRDNYSGTVLNNIRSVISPNELDIYIPDLHLAIEYNGCYFHSTERGTTKDYHLKKSLACRNLGIRLIHVYDFEDFDRQVKLILNLITNNIDEFNPKDFNKNNLLSNIPKPTLIYSDTNLHVYGIGKLYKI